MMVGFGNQRISKANPNLVPCYICSRTFSKASLPIHLPQCKKKWEREQAKLPKHLRRKLVDRSAREAMSMTADDVYAESKASMVPCTRCGRSFATLEKVQRHQKLCNGNSMRLKAGARNGRPLTAGVGPRPGTSGSSGGSPAASRGSRPRTSGGSGGFGGSGGGGSSGGFGRGGGGGDLDSQAVGGSGSYDIPDEYADPNARGGGATCHKCNRTFSDASRVAIHLKSCKGPRTPLKKAGGSAAGTPSSRPGSTKKTPSSSSRPKTGGGGRSRGPRACYCCGKMFGSASFPLHIPRCEELYEKQQLLKPAHERVSIAKLKEGIKDVNNISDAEARMLASKLMVQCKMGCGRTFELPEKMERHAKVCNGVKRILKCGSGTGGGANRGQMSLPSNSPSNHGKAGNIRPVSSSGRPTSSAGRSTYSSPGSSLGRPRTGTPGGSGRRPLSGRGAGVSGGGGGGPSSSRSSPYRTPKGASRTRVSPSPAAAPSSRPSTAGGTAKFCVECGSKFSTTAKFCMECGTQRP